MSRRIDDITAPVVEINVIWRALELIHNVKAVNKLPPTTTLINSVLLRTPYLCFLRNSNKTGIIPLIANILMIFLMGAVRIYCEVGTESFQFCRLIKNFKRLQRPHFNIQLESWETLNLWSDIRAPFLLISTKEPTSQTQRDTPAARQHRHVWSLDSLSRFFI